MVVASYRAVAFRRGGVACQIITKMGGVLLASLAFASVAMGQQAGGAKPVTASPKDAGIGNSVPKKPQPPSPNIPPPAPAAAPVLPSPIIVPPPPAPPAPFVPFANLPAPPLDEVNNGVGIAQKWTRERGLQGRILWIDATANLDKVNTADKIAALVAKIKQTGFNTIVFEIKPIIGYTMYPSKYAPKLTEWVRPWGTQTLPIEYDPLKEFVAQTKMQGIGLIVNMNVFAEGHREFKKGPGYDNPTWQTILYEPGLRIHRDTIGTAIYPVTDRPNLAPRDPDDLSLYTDLTKIGKLDPAAYRRRD